MILSLALTSLIISKEEISPMKPAKERIVEVFNGLNIENMNILDDFYHPDVVFEDPLGEHRGLSAVRAYYENLYQNVNEIRFEFSQIIGEENKYSAEWVMIMKADGLNGGDTVKLAGVSTFEFDSETQLVRRHRDYFDMNEFIYQHIPIVRSIVGMINSRLKN